ncbi:MULTISPECIES: hypothetical protein [unclassified Actinomadura]|uniref:hypothetical protein n=1 Tax=unclassified Actinomadura TaxID=2626254 RepID=UPI0013578CD7|nr:hypothetical protein [Actinomadura sp. K4S16]
MSDKKEIKPFRGMTPAEEAEHHLANAERYAEYMETATPIRLDRVAFRTDQDARVRRR